MKWLFGLGGACVGGMVGFAGGILTMTVCSSTVGTPPDLCAAIGLAFGGIVASTVAGALLGAYLGSKFGPPS